MNAGLLVLRVAVGLLVAGYGVQKVSFRLGGNGLAGGTEEFRHDGFRGGRLTAIVAGGSQNGAGRFLAGPVSGLLARIVLRRSPATPEAATPKGTPHAPVAE